MKKCFKFLKSEEGMALPTALMIMIVAFSFAAITLTYSTSQATTEIKYESNTKALQAAEAGLHAYLWALNKEGATIALNTVITYPAFNPEYGYILEVLEDTVSKKRVKSTGWAIGYPDIKQSVEAVINKKSYTAHVYFTDQEDAGIVWGTGEVCYGSLRTNTSLTVKGQPIFHGMVYYKDSINRQDGFNDSYSFKKGITKDSGLPLPKNNNELAAIAKSGGYHYTGRTNILMNSNGTLKIWNERENKTETKPLPSNGVIYVDSAGVDGTEGANTFKANTGNVFISGKLKGRLTVGAAHNIYITDYNPTIKNFSSVGSETNGVSYATTTFSGPLENPTVTGTDMLGLIANKDVVLLTKGWFGNFDGNVASANGNLNVYAAILAVEGMFYNNNHENTPYNVNIKNELILRGSLAQYKRGAVGLTPSTDSWGNKYYYGYSKNYAYDPRLLHQTPPHFLEPKDSGWEIVEWN